jgi:hypothetical protein
MSRVGSLKLLVWGSSSREGSARWFITRLASAGPIVLPGATVLSRLYRLKLVSNFSRASKRISGRKIDACDDGKVSKTEEGRNKDIDLADSPGARGSRRKLK